jgi:hypothetical protein
MSHLSPLIQMVNRDLNCKFPIFEYLREFKVAIWVMKNAERENISSLSRPFKLLIVHGRF